jgi:hypothetical protein
MGSETKGIDTTGSYRAMNTKGFTLIASLMMLLLLSGIAIGLMMMVSTEGKVGGTDLQNNAAFHSAEGGVEKMTSDLAQTFQNALSPTAAQICDLGLPTATGPTLPGVTWTDYQITPGSLGAPCPSTLVGLQNWGHITGGPNQGLYAQIVPINMLVTAVEPGGQEVSMSRSAQVALIPVFQFGVFSDSDISFYAGSAFDFTGPVHTNGDLYPIAGTGATLTFHSKLSAYGNVVRTQLPNGYPTSTNYTGTVYIPSADGDCSTPGTIVAGNCTAMTAVTVNYGDGSVTGAGSSIAQGISTYNGTNWTPFSNGTNLEIINGNYGSTVTNATGTGGTKLSMPFVGGGALPNEIVRRPSAGESPTSALGASREYNLAQIRVLLSDDPTEFQNGTGYSDPQNVRLANLSAAQMQAQYGNTSASANLQFGIPISSGNFSATTFGSPTSGNTFNLYFAAGSNVTPSTCTSSTACTVDWPYAPLPWTTNPSPTTQGLQPAPPATGPAAPTYELPGSGAPALVTGLCPPITYPLGTGVVSPTGCPTAAAPAYPYYAPPNQNGANLNSSASASAWSLIDGYLRVEYRDASGAWHPVTNEWLSLGFARGSLPPVSGTPNPINPNAILLLQEPADRTGTGVWPTTTATAPVCTTTTGTSPNKKCTAWTGTTPEVAYDLPAQAAGITGTGGEWAFGLTPTTPVAAPPASATPQSLTQYNWYPINFYDVREGEARDNAVAAADNSCAPNGVMNAVEIDVGNLAKWLAGTIPGSGTSVDYLAQNGYILYFSDRRGMLLNPHPPLGGAASKSGDAGLEDVINRSSGPGVPDGILEAIPANRSFSPEDVNENTYLDNYGPLNMGLGFWGTVASSTQNLNLQINSGLHPDPFGSDTAGNDNSRIASCSNTGRKNWVSGARHALRLVDGALGQVPRRTDAGATLDSPGGFTVASENPLYIWGDYNSNAADAAGWAGDTVEFQGDVTGHSADAVIADAVTLLSVDWNDLYSLGAAAATNPQVTNQANRNPSHDGHFRVAIAGGKNMNFQQPTYTTPAAPGNDFGTDGGVHNFLRYLENWGGQTMYYKGSLVSLFYATYGTGTFKCCNVVYGVPVRAFHFDLDFTSPGGLPPGTPMFRDVNALSYRQAFTTRTY